MWEVGRTFTMANMSTQMQFTLGDALRKSRTQPQIGSRLSQEFMAERLHVSRPTVGAWEKGETTVPFWVVKAWSQITGWPMGWFEETTDAKAPASDFPDAENPFQGVLFAAAS